MIWHHCVHEPGKERGPSFLPLISNYVERVATSVVDPGFAKHRSTIWILMGSYKLKIRWYFVCIIATWKGHERRFVGILLRAPNGPERSLQAERETAVFLVECRETWRG